MFSGRIQQPTSWLSALEGQPVKDNLPDGITNTSQADIIVEILQ